MAILNSTACKSSYGRLTYIFNQSAHNTSKTNHRVLACSGTNINMLHTPNGHLSTLQSGAYLEKQFHQSLNRAYNPKRKYQAQSIIISFSSEEFDTSDLKRQATQAMQLVEGYVHQHFSDAQSVSCVQCDGDGGKLHVHLLINTVKTNGKTVPTNRFSVYRMRRNFNEYLERNFQLVTGREWSNSFNKASTRKDAKTIITRSSWEEQLKQTINQVKQEVRNVVEFINRLSTKGIQIKERGKKKQWTYTQIIPDKNGKPKLHRVRAYYQRKDKAEHVLSTRGLGQAYTRQGLDNYWRQQLEKEQEITPVKSHYRKEVKTNDRKDVQTEREELIKIRTLARDAQAAANERQRRIQLNLQKSRSADVEERKQRTQSQTGSTTSRRRDQSRSKSISKHQRYAETTQRLVKKQQERAKRTNGKDVGPDL
ncbi:relaxase/mobilization nuclease domain-containing protein [Limosilactobacillus reuteri]|uniref:relaxase/mobilization nuclease domain-containing protein n=1 Tax=Limosilactobacillus reuteri TaxID=1598 RepID=UPI0021A5C279|nr:relaxase/mobilization nuclease domain-containing protein [Limosilactobacillus reuteri]